MAPGDEHAVRALAKRFQDETRVDAARAVHADDVDVRGVLERAVPAMSAPW